MTQNGFNVFHLGKYAVFKIFQECRRYSLYPNPMSLLPRKVGNISVFFTSSSVFTCILTCVGFRYIIIGGADHPG